MSFTRVAAVTGANKGLGFAIVRNLCLAYPKSALSSSHSSTTSSTSTTSATTSTSTSALPLIIYLTARSSSRGNSALESLTSDPALRSSGVLAQDGGPVSVLLKELDVVEEESITEFGVWMGKEHEGGMDILVNNAGVALDGIDTQNTRLTLQTNYNAPLNLTSKLLRLLRLRAGRVVTLGSLTGKLTPQKFSANIRQRFLSATSVVEISTLLEEYQRSMDAGTWTEDGWPVSAYVVSKAGVIGAMGLIGRDELSRGEDASAGPVLVNTCCPGYVVTDMTKQRGRKTPDQGSRTPVKLALGSIDGVGGEFWEHEEISKWG